MGAVIETEMIGPRKEVPHTSSSVALPRHLNLYTVATAAEKKPLVVPYSDSSAEALDCRKRPVLDLGLKKPLLCPDHGALNEQEVVETEMGLGKKIPYTSFALPCPGT